MHGTHTFESREPPIGQTQVFSGGDDDGYMQFGSYEWLESTCDGSNRVENNESEAAHL